MFNEYLYEIIALIIILTLIVIYFLTRKFKQEEIESLEYQKLKSLKNTTDITSIQPENIQEQTQEEEKEEKGVNFVFEEQNEGIFGEGNDDPFENSDAKLKDTEALEEKTSEKEPPKQETYVRKKATVPPHGKIAKENFKDFAGVKLLVAEDNIINQKVISGLLSNSGIEITMAENGQIALDILQEDNQFDMILMDAHMPVLDGFETTRKIRQNPLYDPIVIVALSGDIAVDDIRKMTEAGMQEHLEKPLRMDPFYDILYTYTKGNNTTSSQENVEVIMTKELHGDKGLAICGGDEDFYRDILTEFTTTYSNASEKLLAYIKKKDLQAADAFLLDFVGITANIGAENIRGIALELKESMKDDLEQSYVTTLDDFDIHLKTLLNDIAAYNK